MLSGLKKLLRDTTQENGRYVAKDVRNQTAFAVGVGLCVVSSLKLVHVHNELALQAGGLLLAYSLGGAAVKSYYQYKNNQVAQDASCAPVAGDSDASGESQDAEKQ